MLPTKIALTAAITTALPRPHALQHHNTLPILAEHIQRPFLVDRLQIHQDTRPRNLRHALDDPRHGRCASSGGLAGRGAR